MVLKIWSPVASASATSEMLYSDEGDAGALIAAIDGLVTVDATAAAAVLKDQAGNKIIHSSYAGEGAFIKAQLRVNGIPYTQIASGVGITPAKGEWGLDTAGAAEKFVVRTDAIASGDTDTYSIAMEGEKA